MSQLAHVTFSCEYYIIMNEVLPQGPSFSLPFAYLSSFPPAFVSFCHRDVTVRPAAPPLLDFYKALLEVGQI